MFTAVGNALNGWKRERGERETPRTCRPWVSFYLLLQPAARCSPLFQQKCWAASLLLCCRCSNLYIS